MELDFYSISSLKTMEVIEISSGTRLGFIKDFKIDTEGCKIISILLPSQNMSLFGKNDDMEIPWEDIKKVGVDVILVNAEEHIEHKLE